MTVQGITKMIQKTMNQHQNKKKTHLTSGFEDLKQKSDHDLNSGNLKILLELFLLY